MLTKFFILSLIMLFLASCNSPIDNANSSSGNGDLDDAVLNYQNGTYIVKDAIYGTNMFKLIVDGSAATDSGKFVLTSPVNTSVITPNISTVYDPDTNSVTFEQPDDVTLILSFDTFSGTTQHLTNTPHNVTFALE